MASSRTQRTADGPSESRSAPGSQAETPPPSGPGTKGSSETHPPSSHPARPTSAVRVMSAPYFRISLTAGGSCQDERRSRKTATRCTERSRERHWAARFRSQSRFRPRRWALTSLVLCRRIRQALPFRPLLQLLPVELNRDVIVCSEIGLQLARSVPAFSASFERSCRLANFPEWSLASRPLSSIVNPFPLTLRPPPRPGVSVTPNLSIPAERAATEADACALTVIVTSLLVILAIVCSVENPVLNVSEGNWVSRLPRHAWDAAGGAPVRPDAGAPTCTHSSSSPPQAHLRSRLPPPQAGATRSTPAHHPITLYRETRDTTARPVSSGPAATMNPMPQTCSICKHDQRNDIDQDLLGGASLRETSGRYGVSSSSLDRHRRGCCVRARLVRSPGTRSCPSIGFAATRRGWLRRRCSGWSGRRRMAA